MADEQGGVPLPVEAEKLEVKHSEAVNGDAAVEAPKPDTQTAEADEHGVRDVANGDAGALAATKEVVDKVDDEVINGAEVKEEERDADDKAEKREEADHNEDEKSDLKRKSSPVPVSAHDRYDRANKRGRGSGRGGYGSRNIKTRFDDQPESNDPDEIRRQVEFYFSDSNLPIDAYLLSQTGGHENKPVSLKVIHNFKRMRHFQPFSAVRDAVKESKFLDLNADDEITRKTPLSEKFGDDAGHNRTLVHTSSMNRSIYAKGFGEEKATTHLDIEAFFAPYGPLNSVRLRRKEDGEFKGSVFVEFGSEEAQQAFLAHEGKPQWEDGKDLEIMSKQEYVDIKHQGIVDGVVKPRSPDGRGYKKGRGGHNDRDRDGGRHGNRGGNPNGRREWIPEDEWKARRDRDQRDGHRGGKRGGRGGRGRRDGDRDRHQDRRRNRRDRDDEDDDYERNDGDRDEMPPSRAEAEAKKAEKTADGQTGAGAEDVGGGVAVDASAGKKRAREDDQVMTGEAKKARAGGEEVEA